jgi:putative two-component system response regulator
MNPIILLVDVASAERENWKVLLENQNFDVITADNAESARQICLRLQPDVVVLHDHLHDHLPQVRGAGSCCCLKQDPLDQLTPAVFISSKLTLAELTEGHEASAPHFSSSLGHEPGSIEPPLRLKSYMDERGKSVILSLAHNIEASHSRTDGHSERLAERAMQLGERLGLSEEDLRELRLGCLLHDIGKLAVPEHILLKPARLNAEETEIVRQHPVTGEKICAPFEYLRPILPLIRHHHERMDGSGYPDGLYGEEIPLKARILQVADVYDALTSDRPYREALTSEEALEILGQEATYGRLDAALVSKVSRMWRSGDGFPIGRSSKPTSFYA